MFIQPWLQPALAKFADAVQTVGALLALPDPIPTLTVNSKTYDFARIGMTDTSGIYQTADGLDRLTISHQYRKRNRFSVRLDRNFLADDPFVSTITQRFSHSVYTVIDTPQIGVDPVENDWLYQLHAAIMAAGTPDYSKRILQGEL
jgi:hypothetical protein